MLSSRSLFRNLLILIALSNAFFLTSKAEAVSCDGIDPWVWDAGYIYSIGSKVKVIATNHRYSLTTAAAYGQYEPTSANGIIWWTDEGVCDASVVLPTLTTTAMSTITTTTASSGGNVTSDGGGALSSRGVCWVSGGGTPTTGDLITSNGTSTGSVAAALASLTPNTAYKVRAYAINSAGTAYGNEISFSTLAANSAPTASDNTVSTNENVDYTFLASDFNFADADGGDVISRIQIITEESVGTLYLDANTNGNNDGEDIVAYQVIELADIPKITFEPVADEFGAGYDSFTFKVNDNSVYSASAYTMTIDVNAVNDAPVINSTAGTSATEDLLYTYTTSVTDGDDANNGTDLTYSLTNEPTGMAVSTTGVVTWTPGEGVTTSGAVTLTVQDGGENGAAADTEIFTITVTPVNDNTPVVTTSQSFSIAENIANSGAVGTAAATDGDAGTTFSSWTETGGTGAAIFEINAGTGAITVTDNSAINYEATTSYTYTVTVSDGSITSGTETITINITDINDVTPVITASQTFSVNEDVANTTSVGTVAVGDGDITATTYSAWTITAGNGDAIFGINGTSGEITVVDNTNLDYESITSYTLTLTVSDGVNTSSTETVTVDVNAINDNTPVVTTSQSFDIAEDIANSGAVGTALATDSDAGTTFSSWTEIGGTGAAIFEINAGSGAITVTDNSAINYEATTSYTYTVTVSDGSNTSATETITINITDINDATPVITTSQTFSVNEDVANTTSVGTVVVGDGDITATTYSAWTITLGNTNSVFAINGSTGEIIVNDANELDFESIESYTLTLTVSDGVNTSSTETVVVDVNAINDEVPTITSTSTVSIDENTSDVIFLTATDGDVPSTLTYSKIGGADLALFTLNPTTGELTFTSAPDFEAPSDAGTDNDYVIQVQVFDGLNSSNQTITVTVDNVTGIVITSNGSGATAGISIAENIAAVTTLTSADEGIAVPAYTIIGGADQTKFSLNSSTGDLIFTAAPNFEIATDVGVNNSYEVIARVTGDGGATADQTITVTITDVNDVAPVVTASQSFSIAEDIANTTVATVLGSDGDAGTTLQSWAIVSGNGNAIFSINSSTGEISVDDNSTIDFETTTSYILGVTVNDNGDTHTSASVNVTINVTNINETPFVITPIVDVEYDGNSGAHSYAKLANHFGDVDAATILTFTVTSSNTSLVTVVASDSLALTLIDEASGVSEIVVTATDGGGLFVTDTFVVTVIAAIVNDDAPTLSTPILDITLQEDFKDIDIVDFSSHFVDIDADDEITYSISYAPTTTANLNVSKNKLTAKSIKDVSGVVSVIVTAVDLSGLSVSDSFEISVNSVNDAPVGIAVDDQTVSVDDSLILSLDGSDIDNAEIFWKLVEYPEEMEIKNGNEIHWNPGRSSLGYHSVDAEVSDGNGGVDTISFTLIVDREISIIKSGNSIKPNQFVISPTVLTSEHSYMEFRIIDFDVRNISITIFDPVGSVLFTAEAEQFYLYRSVTPAPIVKWDGRNRNGKRVTGACTVIATFEMKDGRVEQIKRTVGVKN
jgi:hypothetical protein